MNSGGDVAKLGGESRSSSYAQQLCGRHIQAVKASERQIYLAVRIGLQHIVIIVGPNYQLSVTYITTLSCYSRMNLRVLSAHSVSDEGGPWVTGRIYVRYAMDISL